jgi:hypothetical protein
MCRHMKEEKKTSSCRREKRSVIHSPVNKMSFVFREFEASQITNSSESKSFHSTRASSSKTEEFIARCHCGNVQGRFRCNADKIYALDCNCSDCDMRKNVHTVVPAADFTILDEPSYEDATTLYQWGTKTAVRRFCKTCGVLPWYIARSNPDGYAITLQCVDWTADGKKAPVVVIVKFDGVHWEESFKALNDDSQEVKVSSLSKK